MYLISTKGLSFREVKKGIYYIWKILKSRIEDIKELEYMIDVLIQKRKEEIINNKEFITDIKNIQMYLHLK